MEADNESTWRVYALTDFSSSTSLASRVESVTEELPELLTHHIQVRDSRANEAGQDNENEVVEESPKVVVVGDVKAEIFTNEFAYERCGFNHRIHKEEGIFLVSAPNSFWLKRRDWGRAPMADLVRIKFRSGKRNVETPLVRRLMTKHKNVKRKHTGTNFKDPAYLDQIGSVVVLKGEVIDEEAIVENLPPPPPPPPPPPVEMEVNDNEELTFEYLSTENESLKRQIASLEDAITANDAAFDDMLRSCNSRNESTSAEEFEARWELLRQLIRRSKERNEKVLQR